MKKTFIWIAVLLFIILMGSGIFVFNNLHNRHVSYKININLNKNNPGIIKAGFAALTITPEIPDRWQDKNNDGRYNPKDGDTYRDLNKNGKFDAIWMAGFQSQRPANGIHDDLWARSMIVDNGKCRIAIVSVDAIGIMHDDIIDILHKIPESDNITYTIITSTHTHEGPDLLGLWGNSRFSSGVNNDYIEYVKGRIAESIETAVMSIKPAKLIFSEDLSSAESLVADSRNPVVKDPGVRIIKAIDADNEQMLGELVSWSCHPEVLWNKNLLISSDFVHYVREGIEKGIYAGDSLVQPGSGGVVLYINGCIGGLMTMDPGTGIYDPWLRKELKEAGYDKARSLGYQIASIASNCVNLSADTVTSADIKIIARTISLPLDNKLFRLGESLGVINRGLDGWWKVQSEISVFMIGPATFLSLPGEMYPEIVNGGIESPAGADYSIPPIEVPPLRQLMNSRYNFVFGLANDEIGYIIPQSEWDENPPYLYNALKSPYGEINSLGPKTAPLLHLALQDLLRNLRQ